MAHILIVDDDVLTQQLIYEVITAAGHTCDKACDGAEAVEQVRKKKYDLLVIDWMMPRMSGPQAVAAIRANPKFKDLKIIMCTSMSVTKDVDAAFRAGANDYVLKPINLELLVVKVHKALGLPPPAEPA
jgi:CheY-like chemotaxis protein